MKRVRLIRHGQSESNAGLRTDWPRNVGLTDLGRKQAESVAYRVFTDVGKIVVSDYVRTGQTARSLLELVNVPMETWPVHEFTFLDTVACRNTTQEERSPRRKAYWNRMDPYWVDGEGAESYSQFRRRVRDFMNLVAEADVTRGILNIFTHADFIRGVLFESFAPDGDMAGFYRFCQSIQIANGACVLLEIDKGRLKLLSLDDSHVPHGIRSA